MTPVEAVGHMACRQQKQQPGQKQRQSRISKIERSMRNGIDLPGDRDCLRLGTQNHSHTRHLISAEVAIGKCLHPS